SQARQSTGIPPTTLANAVRSEDVARSNRADFCTQNAIATVSYQLAQRSGKWPVISADQWGLADQIQEPRREAIGCYEKWVGPTTRNEWRPGWLLILGFVAAA